MDPFVVLGVPPTMDLGQDELERRYIELLRDCHPDHQGAATPEQQIAALTRSAAINDAYRDLRDPWRRAARLLELRQPGVLERTKQLCPVFLAEAMELAEEVAESTGDACGELRARIEALIAEDLEALRERIAQGQWPEAATVLHQSRYHRKALEDLKAAV